MKMPVGVIAARRDVWLAWGYGGAHRPRAIRLLRIIEYYACIAAELKRLILNILATLAILATPANPATLDCGAGLV
jgi:hypothetical protein